MERLIKLKIYIKSKLYTLVANIQHASLAILIALCTFIWGVLSSNNQEKKTNEQIDLIKKQINLSVSPSIETRYEIFGENIFVNNIGIHDIQDVEIEFEPFFIELNGTVQTLLDLKKELEGKTPLKDLIEKNTALNIKEDLLQIMDQKEFKLTELKSTYYPLIRQAEEKGLSLIEYHPTNILIFSQLLNTKLVFKVIVRYKQHETNILHKKLFYYLIDVKKRKNLDNILGGEKVIKDIENYCSQTTGEIFK